MAVKRPKKKNADAKSSKACAESDRGILMTVKDKVAGAAKELMGEIIGDGKLADEGKAQRRRMIPAMRMTKTIKNR